MKKFSFIICLITCSLICNPHNAFAGINALWPLPGHNAISTEHCEVNSYGTHTGIDIDGTPNIPVN